MIRRAELADHPWIVASGAEAYRELGDYTRILPSWLNQPGVLAWIDQDSRERGRGFAMLGFYMDENPTNGSREPLASRGHLDGVAGLAAHDVSSQPASPVVADLLALAVLPAFQRHGIGTGLLHHVIDVAERIAPASRIRTLRLTVADTNVGAQRLYERNGFSIVDGSATYDRGQRALRMVRDLMHGW